MNKTEALEYLRTLTNKEFVEFLSEAFVDRRADEGTEKNFVQAHWCVGEASRILKDDEISWEPWEVTLFAKEDSEMYDGGWERSSPICQFGRCSECNTKLASWAKNIKCPVCGGIAYAT